MAVTFAGTHRYKVLAPLGAGAMGAVYLVEDTTSGARRALKLLRHDGAPSDEQLLQFKQEFRAMAKLRHPHTVEVYDYGQLPDGTPFFTMEAIEGDGLDARVPMPPEQVVSVLAQLCRALGTIHQHGFVHCDLKPDNIRLKPDGTIKLMDFGLMEVAGQSGGPIKGTLDYIAPEVAKRDRIDQRSDLYSLGAVAYHLLTGAPPFKAASALEVLRAHLKESPRSPRELNREVPSELSQIVLKLLAKEPLARYQSVAEVLAALGLEAEPGLEQGLLASAFVGRASETAQFSEALARLKHAHDGARLWICGPAGAGKTRLIGEWRFASQLEEVPFLAGTAQPNQAPYGPWIEVLRAVMPLAAEACPELLASHAPLLAKLVPELADGRQAPPLEPDAEKTLMQAAIAEVLFAATEFTGAVLALEDWDHADALSRETLAFVRRNAEHKPLILVGTSQEASLADGGAMTLAGLTPSETRQLCRSMLGSDEVPQGFATQLQALTSGLPRLLGELLEHLVRTGVISREGGRWRLPETLDGGALPADLAELLVSRFEGLASEARRVAELEAVAGMPIGRKLMADVLGLSDEALFDAIDALLQAQLLIELGDRYAFATHELKDVLYPRIPAEQRAQWHAAIAERLEAGIGDQGPDVATASAIARHYLACRRTEPAVRHAYQAAIANKAQYALEVGIALLEAGLALLNEHPEPAWDPLRCDYLIALAEMCVGKHRLDEATAYLEAGLPLAERLNDKARALNLWLTQGAFAIERQSPGSLREGVEIFDRARTLASELGDERLIMLAGFKLGRCLFFLGQNVRALEVLEATAKQPFATEQTYWYSRTLAFYGYLQAIGGGGTDEGVAHIKQAVALQAPINDKAGLSITYNLLTDLQLQLGQYAEAERVAAEEAELMQEVGHSGAHAVAIFNRATALLEMGRFEQAEEQAAAAIKLARRIDHKVTICLGQLVQGLALIQLGQLDRGLERVLAGQALAGETATYVQAYAFLYVIEAYVLLGRLAEAKNTAQEAQFLLRSLEDKAVQMRMMGLLSRIHGGLGEAEMASSFCESHLKEALDAGARGEVVKALAAKASLAIDREQWAEAEKYAEQAFSRCHAIGSHYQAARLKGLLGEIQLAKGLPEALGHFREMQALADQVQSPTLRASALFGQALANPGDAHSNQLILEAQKLLRGITAGLDHAEREAFYQPLERRRIRDKNPLLQEETTFSLENSQLVAERLNRVSQDLAAVAGQYGAMLSELNTKSRQLEMLNRLAHRINESLVLDDVLHMAVTLTLELTKAERGFLLLHAEEDDDPTTVGPDLICRAAFDQFGRSLMGERFSLMAAEKVMRTQQALAILDASQDEELQSSKSVQALNLRTLMCVPLQVKGRALGVLYVDSQALVTTFTSRDLELLKSIASHISVAIENAKLYSNLNERAHELEHALAMYHKAAREANTDMLTGMFNRRWFIDNATRELEASRRYGRDLTVIILDVDHFKKFNDTYGHALGDEVLKAVGRVLPQAVRNTDLPARLGGEEFVALCPETDLVGAQMVAERIREWLAKIQLHDADGQPVRPITASLGVAAIQPGDETIAAMLDRADMALYHAKANGRNQVQLWTPEMAGVPSH